jgi:hypothetical protein
MNRGYHLVCALVFGEIGAGAARRYRDLDAGGFIAANWLLSISNGDAGCRWSESDLREPSGDAAR